MLSMLGNYLERKFADVPTGSDVDGFLRLLLLAVESKSLIVSIPVLVTWTRLLNNRLIGQSSANSQMIGPLLELCGSRLIRYENLPEDTQDPTYLFLMEDTDTVPERHAFLGNYRRYSMQVIEAIVLLKPQDAIFHILNQTEHVLQTLYDGQPALDSQCLCKPHGENTELTTRSFQIRQVLDACIARRRAHVHDRRGNQGLHEVEDESDSAQRP